MNALLTIDVSVEDGDWPDEADSSRFCRRVLEAAAAGSGLRIRPGAAVSVLLTDDAGVRALNREWRGLDRPTNVLSFQAVASNRVARAPALGDIVLARGVLEREAAEEGRSVEAHWAHLLVHGFLHLAGLDHDDPDEGDRMEQLETRILDRLGVADPYALTEPLA